MKKKRDGCGESSDCFEEREREVVDGGESGDGCWISGESGDGCFKGFQGNSSGVERMKRERADAGARPVAEKGYILGGDKGKVVV
ncbi:hypothetical protein QYF36_015604 [Acer negundo]|nr:hypothetical protein QYF36_015604 [Acer negundo]